MESGKHAASLELPIRLFESMRNPLSISRKRLQSVRKVEKGKKKEKRTSTLAERSLLSVCTINPLSILKMGLPSVKNLAISRWKENL